MKNTLKYCPNCGKDMMITRYTCTNCPTEVTGFFSESKFSKLSEEDLHFIELFVMSRGNIKELEKKLNLSYPSVRSRLDQVIKAFGHEVESEISQMEVLNLLDAGEITMDEALKLLKGETYE